MRKLRRASGPPDVGCRSKACNVSLTLQRAGLAEVCRRVRGAALAVDAQTSASTQGPRRRIALVNVLSTNEARGMKLTNFTGKPRITMPQLGQRRKVDTPGGAWGL